MNNTYSIVRFKPLYNGPSVKFPVDDWNVQQAMNLVDLKRYKCFWFEKIESDVQEQPGVLTVKSRVIKNSDVYFIDAYTETIEDVKVRDQALAKRLDDRNIKQIVCGINADWADVFNDRDSIVELK